MSFVQPFQSYQPYGSKTAGSEAKKPFSSTVDFSDQSYEMPFFVDVEPATMKPGGSVARKPLAVQPITNAPQSIPKQSPDDRNTKIPQGNTSPVMTKGPEKAPLLPPRKPTFKANPAAFLESFEFPSMQNFYIEPTAPNPNSYQWLSQDPLFINWRSSKHGLLWLRGSEGCGKSTLMKHALHSQLKEEPNAIHLTYSFSMCGSELPRSRLGFYKVLMHQLIPQSPEIFSDVKARFEKIESALPLRQQVAWGAQELYEDLTKAVTKILKTQSVNIYVDGIDRSEGETAPKLVQDFSKLLEKSQPKPTAKEPTIAHGLKIVFSSTLIPAKDPLPRSYIDVDEKNGPSLAQFLEEQLSTIDFNTRQLVLSKSGSSFISARLIINHVKLFGPAQSSLVQQPSPTPAPISFLLVDYFQNLAQQGNKSLMSLLTWCCLTSRPLTLAELRVALSLDMMPKLQSSKDLLNAEPFSRYSSDESFQSWVKTTSWGLIETVTLRGQRVVKVIHDSISAFFVSKGLDMLSFGSQQPDSPSSPPQRAHHSLALCLLRYLALLPKEPQWQSRFQTEPALQLLQYAGTNWSIHVSAASLSKPEASKILKLLQWPSDSVLSPLVKLDQENSAIAELQGTLWAHIFAVYGHAPLLSVGIKKAGTEVVGLRDTQKRTPLHHAALHGHLAASKQLLKSGAKANAQATSGQTALHYAVLQGYQSVLKPLLDSDPSLVSATNEFAQTPLHLAVVRGNSSVIKLLLERNADTKSLDRFDNSILHHAVATDKANVLKQILDGGADINLQDGQGRTPLHLAIAENRSAVIKVLFERSCRVDISDKEGKSALHLAAASGNKSCAQELLRQKVPVDLKDVHGQTALVYAVQGLHINLIKLLLEAKADVNMKDKLGFTALMLAVRANQEKITKLLLEANPDLNALSSEGHTVIYYAVYRGKAVPLLSDQEQFVASLLLKHYKKRYSVWDQEWLACKDRFAAEHGKKKDVDAKSKSKTESKKKTAPPSSSVPSKTARAPKPVKPLDVAKPAVNVAKPTANAGAQMTASKASPPVAGSQESIKHGPQSGATNIARSQATATTYYPFTSGGPAPVTPPVVQQQQTSKPNTSTSMSTDRQQPQQTSSFMSYQPSQPTVGAKEQVTPNSGGPLAKPTQPPQPAVVTEHQKPPVSHRNSWAMYSALSSSSPVSSQGTPPAVQNSYFSYSSPSQQPSNSSNSFKPFQPFQPDQTRGASPVGASRPQGQVDHRSSLPSQRSLGQAGQTSSDQPAAQQGPAQGYQPFNSNAQTSSPSPYQSQTSYQSPMDPSIKPTAPLSLGRKPVGGHQSTQPVTDQFAKPSPNNLWQPYQTHAIMGQSAPGRQKAQSSVASPPLAGPNTLPQAGPGKQSPAPATSQRSMPAQQGIPAQKPPNPQQGTPSAHVVASKRPALSQNPAAQNPAAAQPNPSQMPAPAQQPIATQRPVLAKTNQTPSPVQSAAPGRKPVPGQAPPAQKPAAAQQPSAGQFAQAPKAFSSQKPPSSQKPAPAQQSPANQKPTISQAPPVQKPLPAKQPGADQKSASAKQATADQKSAPAKQTATGQKPASGQAPQGQRAAPAKPPATDQKPPSAKQTATDKKPAPVQAPQAQKPAPAQQPASASKPSPAQQVAQSSGSSQKAQSSTGQRSVETYGSHGMHTQGHDANNDGSGKSSAGKIAAVTGAGLVAGGVGGYMLSNYYEEHHYENNFVNDERSMNPDQGYYQPVPPSTHTEYYYLQTPAEQSEHSAEKSESGESEDDHQSDDESETHESESESVSFSADVSDAEDSDDQALSEDEEDDGLESINDDSDDGDDAESLNLEEDDSDSPHFATNFTDDENEDDNGDDSDIGNDVESDVESEVNNTVESDVEADENTDADVSDDDIISRSIQADSDSDHDTDLGQDDSDSDSDSDSEVAQEVESDQDSDVEPQYGNFTGYHQHQIYDEADSDNEEQQGYYDNHQQHAVEESDSEDEVQQSHYHDQYQDQQHFQEQTYYQDQTHYHEQAHYQNEFQQQTFQQEDSDEDDQPVHYSNQQHVVQSDSEDEDEVQQDHYHGQYQQQNQYGQYQQQVQSESENESDNEVNGQVDDSDEDENNYGQDDSDNDGYNAGGNYGGENYTGAGYDSDDY